MSKFRAVRVWLFVALLIAAGTFAVGAQVPAGEIASWIPQAEIVDTGDSPVGVVSMGEEKRFEYGLYSKSGKAVVACVVVVRAGDEVLLKQVLHGGPGYISRRNPFNIWRHKDVAASAWAIDWVLFLDGTKWGPDTQGRSADVLSYRKGQAAAFAKAAELDIPMVPLAMIRGWEFKLKGRESLTDRSERAWFNAGFDEGAILVDGIHTGKGPHPYGPALAELKRSRDVAFKDQ